jgi:RNA polymerase sigma-70 factor (ECF subfamily)
MSFVRTNSKRSATAYEELYDRYADKLYRYAIFLINDTAKTEDIIQNIFISLYDKLINDKNEINNLNAYLHCAVKNQVYKAIKKNEKEVEFEETKYEQVVQQNYDDTELFELIKKAINKLEPKYKEPYVLKEFNGMSHKEIAEILNLSVEGVRTRVHRAQLKIKEELFPVIKEINEI